MNIISARANPERLGEIIAYIQEKWASAETMKLYEDCVSHCVGAKFPLPEWFILEDDGRIIGCAGLITNDFVSRMDLCPWLCALYVEPDMRGRALGKILIERVCAYAEAVGFEHVYLVTDHIGYYEKFGFAHVGTGYHPWGESSRIYACRVIP